MRHHNPDGTHLVFHDLLVCELSRLRTLGLAKSIQDFRDRSVDVDKHMLSILAEEIALATVFDALWVVERSIEDDDVQVGH